MDLPATKFPTEPHSKISVKAGKGTERRLPYYHTSWISLFIPSEQASLSHHYLRSANHLFWKVNHHTRKLSPNTNCNHTTIRRIIFGEFFASSSELATGRDSTQWRQHHHCASYRSTSHRLLPGSVLPTTTSSHDTPPDPVRE